MIEWELDLWYEMWDRAGSEGLDTWHELGGRTELVSGNPEAPVGCLEGVEGVTHPIGSGWEGG